MDNFPLSYLVGECEFARVSNRLRKTVHGRPRNAVGTLTKALSISFYPEHLDVLSQRVRELNVPRSVLLQLLLEIEAREDLLRQELIGRLTSIKRGVNATTTPKQRTVCV